MFQNLISALRYSWEPFTADGRHLTFKEHLGTRLERGRCSGWGPAVYKWEGIVRSGEHVGKRAVLIGETGDLRQRIKQYLSGTQERGNSRLFDVSSKLPADVREAMKTVKCHGDDAAHGADVSIEQAEICHEASLRILKFLVSSKRGPR